MKFDVVLSSTRTSDETGKRVFRDTIRENVNLDIRLVNSSGHYGMIVQSVLMSRDSALMRKLQEQFIHIKTTQVSKNASAYIWQMKS